MSDDHAKRVAEIEAVTKDYAEALEPPKYEPPTLDAAKAIMEALSVLNVQPGGLNFVDDLASLMSTLFTIT